MLEIAQAGTPEDMEQARELFREYAASLNFDLRFQGFEEELAGLPGKYAPPDGRLFLARYEGKLAGCVALKKLEEGVCEMKRLYLRPGFRGRGIGRALVKRLVDEAKECEYTCMRLDTVPGTMGEAVALYRTLGFREIHPYVYNPVEGAIFLELTLK